MKKRELVTTYHSPEHVQLRIHHYFLVVYTLFQYELRKISMTVVRDKH